MVKIPKKINHSFILFASIVSTALLVHGCDINPLWRGMETVTVSMDTERITVNLKGLPLYEFKGKNAVRLSEVIQQAGITNKPEDYFYNFIATDGYSLKALLINEKRDTGLPPWEDMERGYLYESASYELMVGWEEDTIGGDYGGCYQVKYMDGGTIEILENDIDLP
jgi:hypothetical protein